MQFLIPDTKKKTKFLLSLTAKDLLYIIIGLTLFVLIWASSMPMPLKIIFSILISIVTIFAVITIDVQKGGIVLINYYKYITRRKKWAEEDISGSLELGEYICYGNGVFSSVIQLNGLNFSILSEESQNKRILGFMQVLQELRSGKIIKLEEPINLLPYIDTNNKYIEKCEQRLIQEAEAKWGKNPELWQSQEGTPEDLKRRILQNQNDHLASFNQINNTNKSAFYLVIQETSRDALRAATAEAIAMLQAIGLFKKQIIDDENGLNLTEFLKRVLSFKTDVSDVNGLTLANTQEKATKCIIDGKAYQTICVHR